MVHIWSLTDSSPTQRLAELAELDQVSSIEGSGYADLAWQESDMLVALRPTPYGRKEILVASDSPESPIVGFIDINFRLKEDLDLATIGMFVSPEYRRRGIGTALLQAAEARVAEAGRNRLLVEAALPEAGQDEAGHDLEALTPPTGSGRVPVDHVTTRFAQAKGFQLEQSFRHSVQPMPLPAATRAELGEKAAARSADYQIVGWVGATPENLIEHMVRMRSQMSVDDPHGEVEKDREIWDAERIRAGEARNEKLGWDTIWSVAQHRTSGTLAAYTALFVRRKPGIDFAFQADTFVLAEHRGHSLGLAVKLANIDALAARYPKVERAHTYNADENSWMLNINVAIGYRPQSLETVWSRKLA